MLITNINILFDSQYIFGHKKTHADTTSTVVNTTDIILYF